MAEMAGSVYFTRSGTRINRGSTLGTGGEGEVFQVAGSANLVAKLYHVRLASDKIDKLEAMVGMGTPKLHQLTAWPHDVILDRPNGSVIGFLMQRIDGFEEIHDLYSPRSRLQRFPDANWKFLSHTAINLSRAVNVVHDQGVVIGDINEKNIRVSGTTEVRLIDCDSFQITMNGNQYLCEVGVEHFTPPELQGKSFHGVVRTADHDAFGLAVLIFQLLFMGRHPFSGRYLWPGEMPPLSEAIKGHRFAYGSQSLQRKMEAPPLSLPLSTVGLTLSTLFERAFAPVDPTRSSRPTPKEWASALKEFLEQLRPCSKVASHQYLPSAGLCPWCSLESQGGMTFFMSVISPVAQATGASGIVPTTEPIAVIWARIVAVPAPSPVPTVPTPTQIQPSREAIEAAAWMNWSLGGAVAVGFVAVVITLAIPMNSGVMFWAVIAEIGLAFGLYEQGKSHFAAKRSAFEQALQTARSNLRQIQQTWDSSATNQSFNAEINRLAKLKSKYEGLPSRRNHRIQELQSRLRQKQKERFLDSFRIDRADIPGVGPGRSATLMSYGIETALDVTATAIRSVPGFGPNYTHRLLAWRDAIDSQFRFNSSAQLASQDVAAIDAEITRERQRILNDLNGGPARLASIKRQMEQQQQTLKPKLKQALDEVAEAEANMRPFS